MKKAYLLLMFFYINDLSAQSGPVDLPTLKVVAPSGNIHGWVTLCVGPSSCTQLLGSIVVNSMLNNTSISIGDSGGTRRRPVRNIRDNHSNTEDEASSSDPDGFRINHARQGIRQYLNSLRIGVVLRI